MHFNMHEYMHAYIPTFTTCSNTGVGSHQGHDSPIESAVGLGGGHNRRHDHPLTDEEDDDLVCAAEHTVYVTFSKVLLQKTLRSQPFVSHPHTPSCVSTRPCSCLCSWPCPGEAQAQATSASTTRVTRPSTSSIPSTRPCPCTRPCKKEGRNALQA